MKTTSLPWGGDRGEDEGTGCNPLGLVSIDPEDFLFVPPSDPRT